MRAVHLFSIALPHFVHAVGHDNAHGDEVICWSEAAGGEVALFAGLLVLFNDRLAFSPCIVPVHNRLTVVDPAPCCEESDGTWERG